MDSFESIKHLAPKVEELISMGFGRYRIKEALGIKESQARALINYVLSDNKTTEDSHDIMEVITQKQKIMDKTRIRQKEIRESSRRVAVLEDLTKEMIGLLESKNLSRFTKQHSKYSPTDTVGIIQISDTHFNELINIDGNKYDFQVAAARLKLLAEKSKIYFSAFGVKEVLIAMTGDLINSDRRLDEILNATTNRTKATFLAVDILQQFILDINSKFNVSVAYVSGNESRVKEELGWNTNPVSDSYDTTIFYTLKLIFKNAKGINFIESDCSESVIRIGDMNILLMHGHGCIQGSIEKSIEQLKGRYASHGIIVDYVLFGHIHSAIVGDHFSRSSSLCGSNAYNERGLNIRGKASQCIFLVSPGKMIDGIKVDLQITEGEGYNVDTSIAEYNPKSEKKIKETKTIFEVVV